MQLAPFIFIFYRGPLYFSAICFLYFCPRIKIKRKAVRKETAAVHL